MDPLDTLFREYVEVAAYYNYLNRESGPDDPDSDWYQAEAQIEAMEVSPAA